MEFVEEYIAQVEWRDLIFGTLRILLILVLAWVAIHAAKVGLQRLEQRLIASGRQQGDMAGEAAKRAETLVRLLRQAIIIVIWVMALLIVLNELGVAVAPILASAGVVGLAVGFGAQNLVRDVISGFFMILENQVRIGDVAVVNGTGGLVEQINFRTLVLRDLSGVVHIFPNGTITTLANLTKQWSAYVFDIGVAYKEDTDRVVEILKQVGTELRADEYFGPLMVDDVEVFGVDAFADSAVMIKGRLRTLPIKQWEVGRQFLRRVKQAFDREGVEIPFPHRSLYFGEASKPILARLVEEAGMRADNRPAE
ncbi:MAG: mechanosensitive ion channel family protein [Gammaproteobacteria bacterium]|nr:mechanosensitive ion channel family protein [Gammaproteobacteria bacterium]